MSIVFEICSQPVGCLVYAKAEQNNLSLGEFATNVKMEILEVTKIIAAEGGFAPEPKDALAFFLFQDRAEAFIGSMQNLL